MRVAILIAALMLAESLGAYTGWKLSQAAAAFLLCILAYASVFDFLEAFKK